MNTVPYMRRILLNPFPFLSLTPPPGSSPQNFSFCFLFHVAWSWVGGFLWDVSLLNDLPPGMENFPPPPLFCPVGFFMFFFFFFWAWYPLDPRWFSPAHAFGRISSHLFNFPFYVCYIFSDTLPAFNLNFYPPKSHFSSSWFPKPPSWHFKNTHFFPLPKANFPPPHVIFTVPQPYALG